MDMKFDQYSVRPSAHGGYSVVQLVSNIDVMFAAIMAGVTADDFEQSITNTGWVGSCPDWLDLPIVTLPQGELLGMNHLDFMLETIEARGAV